MYIYIYIHTHIYHLSVYIYVSIYLSIYPSMLISFYLSIYLRRPASSPPLPCILMQNGLGAAGDLDLGPPEGRGSLLPIEAVVNFNTTLDLVSGVVTLTQATDESAVVLGLAAAGPPDASEWRIQAATVADIAENLQEVNFRDASLEDMCIYIYIYIYICMLV